MSVQTLYTLIEAQVYESINRFKESGGLLETGEGLELQAYSLGTLALPACANPDCPYSKALVEPQLVEDR